jgi:hypothetical protein
MNRVGSRLRFEIAFSNGSRLNIIHKRVIACESQRETDLFDRAAHRH